MKNNLSIDKLSIYRGQHCLISNINFSFDAGDIVAIVGNNGIGKTTWLKTMAGLLPATHGHVAINGSQIAELSNLERAQRLSLMLQNSPIQPYCKASDRIAHGLMPHLGINHFLNSDERQMVKNMAARLNISHLLSRSLAHMSGGELRLVNIAKCLINHKIKVILLDEPSVFLDLTQKSNLARLLKNHAQRGQIVIFSSHDMDFINQCTNRIIEIKNQQAYLTYSVSL